MTRYRHGPRPLHDYLRHHALATPEKPAIVWYGQRICFAELDDLSDRFAQCLHERGLGQGDVLAICLQNCPQFLIAHFGAQKLGLVVTLCNPHAKAWELSHQLDEVRAAAVLIGDESVDVAVQARLPQGGRHVFMTAYGDLLPSVLALDLPDSVRLPGESAPARPAGTQDFLAEIRATSRFTATPGIELDDIALLLYTSGSSGLPKGAMLSHESALYKAAAAAEGFGLGTDDVLLADVALSHVSGLLTGLALPIYLGATVVLLQRFDALAVLQAVDAFRTTWWYTMAPSLPAVMGCDGADRFDVSSLSSMAATSFGVSLTEALAARWHAFSGGEVFEAGYGLSETHTCDTLMPRDAVRWGSNGKPTPGVELRIVEPASGRDLPIGERGEILLRSPVRFRGYWGQPAASAAAVVGDGWVRTGDIGSVDADGYLTFVGRAKEMIKVWSYSVFPEEVEAILATHPEVAQVAVVGSPDPDRGEVLHAYVVLKPAAAARAGDGRMVERRLLQWCDAHMAHYKVPRHIVLQHGLPTAESGKLLRRMLKQPVRSAPEVSRYASL